MEAVLGASPHKSAPFIHLSLTKINSVTKIMIVSGWPKKNF
jgi:hypothetical protein